MMDARTLANALGCPQSVADRYVNDFNIALHQAHCTTVNRVAMYCAQVGHESVGLRYMEEIWGPTAAQRGYEGRRDLGNIYPGDGYRFKGRGPIQLTGRHNYGRFSKWAHGRGLVPTPDYFTRYPEKVATSQYGFLAASWYWTVARNMNGYADRGDIRGASRAVNGGYNGLADRIRRWNHCRSLGSALLPSGGGSAAPTKPQGPNYEVLYGDSMYVDMPKGGRDKHKHLAYKTIPLSILREHDLVIAPGVGPDAGVWIKAINTWKNQWSNSAPASVHKPGGVGAIAKDMWVQRHAGKSLIVPKGVAKIDIAYWSKTDFSIGVFPR